MDATFNQAYTLMTSTKAREAFDLTQEPEDIGSAMGRIASARAVCWRGVWSSGVFGSSPSICSRRCSTISPGTSMALRPLAPLAAIATWWVPMFDNAYSSLLEDLQPSGIA